MMKKLLLPAVGLLAMMGTAQATTGKGCLRIVNVKSWDVLNIRTRASASAPVVYGIDPVNYGVISLRGTCVPKSAGWGSRWCPIVYYSGNGTYKGWVKARFVRDADCP